MNVSNVVFLISIFTFEDAKQHSLNSTNPTSGICTESKPAF